MIFYLFYSKFRRNEGEAIKSVLALLAFISAKELEHFDNNAIKDGLKEIDEKSYSVKFIWLVPFPRNEYFIGRESVLRDIEEELAKKGRVLLYGPGGIGKSQTAVRYAEINRHRYRAVIWLYGEDIDSLKQDYQELAPELGINTLGMKPDDVLSAVKNWFLKNKDWLVIVDNVENLDDINKYLPESSLDFDKKKAIRI